MIYSITYFEACTLIMYNVEVFYKHVGMFNYATPSNIKSLINMEFFIKDNGFNQLKELKKLSLEDSINNYKLIERDIEFLEAFKLLQQGESVYYQSKDGWVLLEATSNISFNELLLTKFKVLIKAKQISFIMNKKSPQSSKRNCFQFENEQFEISIYGRRGIIPCSGDKIQVQITEII